ncbi:MAG: phenylacetate--CoA ligase [Oscillospiraceae bacterium]|nr:phenylacetate--CoA ligase [Oscillospiraceae bacterium]
MPNYWNEAMECMEPEKLKELQNQRLVDTVKRVYEHVPFYRKRMEEAGVKPEDIRGVEDLPKLPFTTKADLRDYYPFDTFAVPMDEIVRIQASSGTTGKQIIAGYTQNDLDSWDECVARGLTSIGVSRKDKVHVSYGYGLFTGGLGAHGGASRVGAAVVPASVGNTKRQMTLLRDLQATTLCCTPSYALHLADALQEVGLTKDDLNLKYGVFGAEPWTEAMRAEIENKLGLKAYDIYGLTEVLGPGVSMECAERNGMHIQADFFIAEIVDPDTFEPLPAGEEGELVFTTITKEGMPMIRYRTKDLTVLHTERCACGRTSPRMEKIRARTDDMLIIRGVNVFPSQIESVILRHAEVEPHYMIYVDRVDNSDTLEVHIEVNEDTFSDQVKKLEDLAKEISADIQSVLGIKAAVRLVEPRSIQRSEGKAVRVIDKRKLYK